ncbi:hypothetical protein [Nocardiopsis dassonvillei]|uniref:hypothetical protein n=1 Tax=Nocardiopsis dassonvillei TaxID=2014 RepID=UPI003F54EDDD
MVMLTGCATQEGDPVDEPARTPPALAVPAGPTAEELALDAYRGMWDVVVEGSHEGAVGHPALEEYASGQALEFTTAMLRGVAATGEPVLSPEVVGTEPEAAPTSVHIEDCVDSSEWLLTEGDEAADTGERKRSAEATVVSGEGGWLVADLWLDGYGSC